MTLPRTAFLRRLPDVDRATVKVPKPVKGPRMRRCKVCRAPFSPRSMTHRACGGECARIIAKLERQAKQAKADRQERAKTKAQIIALKPPKWWRAKAKAALHAFIRARDEGGECISCDTLLLKLGRIGGDFDAGHFRSVGSAKHLALVEENIFGQCKHCNRDKGSNPQEYERRLRLRKGDAHVNALLADNISRKYTIPDYQAMEAHYKALLKNLQQARA